MIVVLAILAALAVPTYQSVIIRSEDARSQVELAGIAREAQANAMLDSLAPAQSLTVYLTASTGSGAAGPGVAASGPAVLRSTGLDPQENLDKKVAAAGDSDLATEMASASSVYGYFAVVITSSGVVGLAMRSASQVHCVGVVAGATSVSNYLTWDYSTTTGCQGNYPVSQAGGGTATTPAPVSSCTNTSVSPPVVPAVWLPTQNDTSTGTVVTQGTADCSGVETAGPAPSGTVPPGTLNPIGTGTPGGPTSTVTPPDELTAPEPIPSSTTVESDPGSLAAITTFPSLDLNPPHYVYAAASNGDVFDVEDTGSCGNETGSSGHGCPTYHLASLGAGVVPSAMVAGVAPDMLHPFGTFDEDVLFIVGRGNGDIYELNPANAALRVVATGFAAPTSVTGFACFNGAGAKVPGNCLDVGDAKGIWQVQIPAAGAAAVAAPGAGSSCGAAVNCQVGTLSSVTGLIYADSNGTAALAVDTDNAGAATLDTVAAGSGTLLGSVSLPSGSAPAGMGNDPSLTIVYYADAGTNRLMSYNPSSNSVSAPPSSNSVSVSAGSGDGTFLDSANPMLAGFDQPVAVHSHWVPGQYYVADAGNNAIRRVCLSTGNSCTEGTYTLWTAATSGLASFSPALTPGAVATAASGLSGVVSVASANGVEYLLAGDSTGARVITYNPATGAIATIASESSQDPQLPSAMAADAGYVYFQGDLAGYDRLFKVPVTGGSITQFSSNTVNLGCYSFKGLTVGGDGLLYGFNVAADCSAVPVGLYRIDPNTGNTTQVSVSGLSDSTRTSAAGLTYANGLLWLYQYNTYATVANLQAISTSTWAVTASYSVPGTDGNGVAVAGGAVYVTSQSGHSLLQVSASTGAIAAVAGGGSAGEPVASDDGVGPQASFNSLLSLSSDGQSLWVVDSGSALRQVAKAPPLSGGPSQTIASTVTAAPAVVTTAAPLTGAGPVSTAVAAGKVWVLGGNAPVTIRAYDLVTKAVSTPFTDTLGISTPVAITTDGTFLYWVAGYGGYYSLWRTSLRDVNTTEIGSYPALVFGGLTVGSDGELYSLQRSTSSTVGLVRIDPYLGTVTSVAVSNLALGSHPSGIVTYSNGALWLYQTGAASSLQKVDMSTWTVTASYNSLPSPDGYALAAAGTNLFATAYGGLAVYQVSEASGAVALAAGSGASGAADGTGSAASFNYVTGISSDGSSLWAADRNNGLRKLAG